MRKNTLIFDLDGTLANTAPDLIATLNRITMPYGLEPVELKDVSQMVGHGAKAMIEKAFSIKNRELSSTLHDALFENFVEDYSSNLANETHIFDGALEAMDRLNDKGYKFCVCTNKMEFLSQNLLDQLGALKRFHAIAGGDTFSFRKPDPRHLEETVKMMGRDINSAIMIGDSSTDINAAKNAGIPSVAVTFGYSDKPVNLLGATCVINHFSELDNAIEQIQSINQAAAP
ncbi:MAG: HAD-IA family hydrolase [Rhizobiaceae bacterium]